MNARASKFDLVRITRTKRELDICPNEIRKMAKRGLKIYGQGRMRFVSRREVARFIRNETVALPSDAAIDAAADAGAKQLGL